MQFNSWIVCLVVFFIVAVVDKHKISFGNPPDREANPGSEYSVALREAAN